jgi:hypothetical protein
MTATAHIFGPYPALPGYNGYVVTGTVSYDGFGMPLTSTLPVYPAAIVDACSYTGITSSIPEPATVILIISGLLGVVGLNRRLKR